MSTNNTSVRHYGKSNIQKRGAGRNPLRGRQGHIDSLQTTADRAILAIRTTGNPNHHLWFNNGTWWCHWTEHLPDYTKRRVRRSLHTKEVGIARVLRDTLLHEALEGRSVFEEEIPAALALAA